MNTPQPTVFVVDDDAATLAAVSQVLLGAGVKVSAYADALRFLNDYEPAAHGCLILDLEMPGLGGLQVQERLAGCGATLPILFLGGRDDIDRTVRAMKNGALDLLVKPVDDAQLIDAVRAALEKDRAAWHERVQVAEARLRLVTLTPRERQVLECVIAGMPNKRTAAELGTVEKTIKVHRGRIMDKTRAGSLAELVRLAERGGVCPRALTPTPIGARPGLVPVTQSTSRGYSSST